MRLHHYVPVSVLASFGTEDAASVVRTSPTQRNDIRNRDRAVLAGTNKREYPLIVYNLRRGRYDRKLARTVCCQRDLYGLEDRDDPLYRALMRYQFLGEGKNVRSAEDFIRLGQTPLDSQTLESGDIGRIDGEFAGILALIHRDEILDARCLALVRRFITLAHLRTPAYREFRYPRVFQSFMRAFGALQSDPRLDEYFGRQLMSFYTRIERELYAVSMVTAVANGQSALEQLGAKVVVLQRFGDVGFVTCDNPARPYRHDRVRAMRRGYEPALTLPTTWITYPISPDRCILVCTDSNRLEYSRISADEGMVRKINTALAQSAYEDIIMPSGEKDVFEPWFDLESLKVRTAVDA